MKEGKLAFPHRSSFFARIFRGASARATGAPHALGDVGDFASVAEPGNVTTGRRPNRDVPREFERALSVKLDGHHIADA